MKLRAGALAGVLVVLAIPATAQSPSTVAVESPQAALIAGQQVQLAAVARDSSGKALSTSSFSWSSSHPEFFTVDSGGVATATGLGVADITAQIGNVRGVVRLQSLPLIIAVTPMRQTMHIGDSQQFSASALDISGHSISNVTFVWALNGDNGGLSVAGSVDQTGMFYAAALGDFAVRAIVYYPSYPGQFVSQVYGAAQVKILGVSDYRITKLISTEDVREGAALRYRRNQLAVNERGQMAFNASLDGLASGLAEYDAGALKLLMRGGVPGVVQNGPVWDFSDPNINASGTVLARVDEIGAPSSLVLISNGKVNTVEVDSGIIETDQIDTSGTVLSRYSLNAKGEFVYRANSRPDRASPFVTSLYRYSSGQLSVDRKNSDPLPGLKSPVVFGTEFGLDDNGVFYFTASDGSNNGVFREDSDGGITRLLMTGDSLSGITVSTIGQVAVQGAGDVVVLGFAAPGGNFVARYSGASIGAAPRIWAKNQSFSVLSFNAGGPALSGYGTNGNGIYTFNGDAVTPVFLVGTLAPSGDPITAVQAAALLINGTVIAQVSTPVTPMTVVSLGPKRTTLFSAGARLNAPVNLTPRDIVPGAKQGGVHITMGGNATSIFQAESSVLRPVILTGDTMPGDGTFFGNYQSRKTPSGDIYLSTDQGIHKISGGQTQLIAGFPQTCEAALLCFTPNSIAVNDNGGLAASLNLSSGGGSRVAILTGNAMRIILRPGDKLAGAGTVLGWGDLAMDAGGRVAIYLTGSSASGYFLYDGGTWSPVAVLNDTDVGGKVIAASQIKAVGNTFYAFLSLANGSFFVGAWNGQWTPLISRGDASPDGNSISSISSFDVNRNGDVACQVNLNGTLAILERSSDRTRMVHLQSDPLGPGWWVRAYGPVDFRDDRTIYFTAWSLTDQYALFAAEAQN